MPYLSSEKIYERIQPLEANIADGPADADFLVAHFKKIPDLVEEMEQGIKARKNINLLKALADYNDNLLRVASTMSAESSIFTAGAAIKLAALAIRKGGDAEWAERIFATYDKTAGDHVRELAQQEAQSGGGENNRREQYHRIVDDIFTASALLPPSAAAEKVHRRAENCLDTLFEESYADYKKFLNHFARTCSDEKKFPGATAILANSYDTATTKIKTFFADQKKVRGKKGKEQIVAVAGLAMSIDAVLIARGHDLPSLDARATNAFCEHFRVMKEINPEAAKETLQSLRDSYKASASKDASLQKGRDKLFVLIEYFQNIDSFSEPVEVPTHLFEKQTVPKSTPLELVH